MKIKILILLFACAATANAQQDLMGFWFNPIDSGYVATFTTQEPMIDKDCDILMLIIDNNKKTKDTTTIVKTFKILHFGNEDPFYTGNLKIGNIFDLYAMKNKGYTIYLITKIRSTNQLYYSLITSKDFVHKAKIFKKKSGEYQ